MPTQAGKCVLIVDYQRFPGINFAMEWGDEPHAFGFLSGRTEVLRHARSARSVQLQLEDGTTLPVTMLEVSPAGMALVVIDPKLLPSGKL